MAGRRPGRLGSSRLQGRTGAISTSILTIAEVTINSTASIPATGLALSQNQIIKLGKLIPQASVQLCGFLCISGGALSRACTRPLSSAPDFATTLSGRCPISLGKFIQGLSQYLLIRLLVLLIAGLCACIVRPFPCPGRRGTARFSLCPGLPLRHFPAWG